jgi:peroxiredoxin
MVWGCVALFALAGCKKEEPATEPAPEAKAPAAETAAAPQPAAPAPAPATTAEAPTSPVLGKTAPDFTLKSIDGKDVSLSSFKGKTVVLEWFNPNCPFVKNSHAKGSLVNTAQKHEAAGVVWLAINSGAPGKQGHELADNQERAKEWKLAHPVLRDEDGKVGHAYGAERTPHMIVIDKAGIVQYSGAIDNSPDGEGQSPTGGTLVNYVDAALEDLAANRPVKTPITKAYGCGVKYGS